MEPKAGNFRAQSMLMDAIVLGAGSGSRFRQPESSKGSLPKQFELIKNRPVLVWSVEALEEACSVRQIVVVAPSSFLDKTREIIQIFLPTLSKKVRVIEGGERRQDSSLKGLELLEENQPWPEKVLIHDACRPILGNTLESGLKFCQERPDFRGWVPGIKVTETLKRVQSQKIEKTVERDCLYRVQTPQIFDFSLLLAAAKKLAPLEQVFTDDASFLEQEQVPVGVFSGDYRNIKLTYEYELELLNRYLERERHHLCESATDTTFTESFPL